MNKSFWAIIAVIIVVFGGILVFKGHKSGTTTTTTNAKPTHHVMGKGQAGVTLVEYGDFQCPYCGAFYPIVKQVTTKYNDQITYQFRNLPLIEIHKNAFAAARAAEAAGLQGKYWEMFDLIYQNQRSWSENNNANNLFENYARQLGLNMEQFKKDAASSQVNDTINADVAEFLKLGLQKGTPTFLLDGKKVNPAYNADDFSKIIQTEIDAKTKH